jgi:hypothetical protein
MDTLITKRDATSLVPDVLTVMGGLLVAAHTFQSGVMEAVVRAGDGFGFTGLREAGVSAHARAV